MLSSTYYYINDVMYRSLYDDCGLILSLIKKKIHFMFFTDSFMCQQTKFPQWFSKEHVISNFLEVHYPSKLLCYYVKYISYSILAIVLHKLP